MTRYRSATNIEDGPFRKVVDTVDVEPAASYQRWRTRYERLECGHTGKLLHFFPAYPHAEDADGFTVGRYAPPGKKRRCYQCRDAILRAAAPFTVKVIRAADGARVDGFTTDKIPQCTGSWLIGGGSYDEQVHLLWDRYGDQLLDDELAIVEVTLNAVDWKYRPEAKPG